PAAAPASTAAASARAKDACSSIAPAYRDLNTPSGTSGQAGHRPPGGGPAPSAAPAAGSGSASGSVNRGSEGAQPGSPSPAGTCPRGPRPRLIVVCATPSRRPISASLTS